LLLLCIIISIHLLYIFEFVESYTWWQTIYASVKHRNIFPHQCFGKISGVIRNSYMTISMVYLFVPENEKVLGEYNVQKMHSRFQKNLFCSTYLLFYFTSSFNIMYRYKLPNCWVLINSTRKIILNVINKKQPTAIIYRRIAFILSSKML